VQETSINLIGRIGECQANVILLHSSDLFFLPADRGAGFMPAREWMRISFELLYLLKVHKKGIRRAAVNSFGYIAKSLGPQDVLSVLLTNLRVQELEVMSVAPLLSSSSRRLAVLSLVSLLF